MKIVTAVVNNPKFIEIQYYTLKKYFIGDYEFIVFNDAKDFPDFTNSNDETVKYKIEETCKKLNILCINIPNNNHKNVLDAAVRCADSMNYILTYQKQNLDKYLLLDSDMFLIDYFDASKYLGYECAVVLQSRCESAINYFWNGIYYFDMTIMKNLHLLNWNCCNNCDVGGMMQHWLKNQMINEIFPTVEEIRWGEKMFCKNNIYFMKHLWSCTWDVSEIPENLKSNKKLLEFLQNDPRNLNGKYFCEIYENVFLHYRAGGNWRNEGLDFHKKLTKLLKDCFLSDEKI
jgi:hypothetical protein